MPVPRIDIKDAHRNHDQDDDQLYTDHQSVKRSAFPDSLYQNGCDDDGNCKSRKINEPARSSKNVGRRISIKGRVGKNERQMKAEDPDEILEIMRPSVGNGP